MKKRFLWLVVLAVAFLAACSPPPKLRDESFLKDTSILTGEPCSAPCWRNITPGETSWNGALTIVEDSLDFANIEQPSIPDSSARLVDFNAKDGSRCCRVYSQDGRTVTSVLTLLAPDMIFGDIIEKYGEPAYFTVETVTDDQALVSALFTDVPLITYVFSAGLVEGEIAPSSEIVGAIYLTKEDMDSVIVGSQLYEWRGYGKLSELADGEFDVTPFPEANLEEDIEAIIEEAGS